MFNKIRFIYQAAAVCLTDFNGFIEINITTKLNTTLVVYGELFVKKITPMISFDVIADLSSGLETTKTDKA